MTDILVISPHPDDETLGCGGTLLRHIAKGDHVHWLIFTTISKKLGYSEAHVKSRAYEIEQVEKAYSFSSTTQFNYLTTRLDTYPKAELVQSVAKVVDLIKPSTIYLPNFNDAHSDHSFVFDAAAACTKSFRFPSVKKVRVYETISETEFAIRPGNVGFKPNLYIEISKYLDKKINIMKLFSGEMGAHPFPRSEVNLRALAHFRGAIAGVQAAEAFISLIDLEIG